MKQLVNTAIMQLYLLLTTAAIIQAGVIKEGEETTKKPCEGVMINGIYHEVEELKTDIDRPYMLAVDYSTNTVYFSYSLNTNDDVFKTASVDLNTKAFADLNGINNGFAQAVDQNNNEVYIGGSDGIYKYNKKSNSAEFFGAKDSNIWTLFVKDKVYYSIFPSQFLYVLVNGESVRYKDLEDTKVDLFIIDKNETIFFTNTTGLYSQQMGTKDTTLYKEFANEGVRGLTTDINGNPYACLADGIYKIDKSDISLKKVVEIDDAFGLAFDKDSNIVYSDATKLIRLKPNKDKTC
ncbi:ommochrome-binding protein-like [Melitaea cinxia]|uniref:ommochrome-binding protein-like n=1 Tax=Melitaea cinxia TaxID=113334 RepID=UPI001E270732|nr:ommochrome-binding protein-like [Melitaea cinxia]